MAVMLKQIDEIYEVDTEREAEELIAKAKEVIADKLTGTIVKEIYVPGRIVNIVQK